MTTGSTGGDDGAAATPTARPTGARHHLTIAEKNQLRACHRARPDMTQELLRDWAHAKFGKWIGRSTIGKIAASPDDACVNQDAKRNQRGRFPAMERELFAFVRAAAVASPATAAATSPSTAATSTAATTAAMSTTVGEHASALSDSALWAKANEILKRTLGETHTVSVGWVQRFKRRHGLLKGHKRPQLHPPAATAPAPPATTMAMTTTTTMVTAPPTAPLSAERAEEELGVGKAPTRKQFLAVDDILLLSQALRAKPWARTEPMDGWREVADALRALEGCALDKSAGACQARVGLLVDHARAGNEAALRKSGSPGEFRRKKQLLAEVVAELDRAAATPSVEPSRGRKRSASELEDSPAPAPAPATGIEASHPRPLVPDRLAEPSDDVARRLAVLETRLELELAAQRRSAEQHARALERQYEQQLERHERQVEQQLASIQQQQASMIELLKVVIEQQQSRRRSE